MSIRHTAQLPTWRWSGHSTFSVTSSNNLQTKRKQTSITNDLALLGRDFSIVSYVTLRSHIIPVVSWVVTYNHVFGRWGSPPYPSIITKLCFARIFIFRKKNLKMSSINTIHNLKYMEYSVYFLAINAELTTRVWFLFWFLIIWLLIHNFSPN